MSPAAVEETMVRAELWLSFGSLVRAYAAAASVSAGPAPKVEAAGETVRVTAGSARLEMRCDPKTGAGNWILTSGESVLRQVPIQLLPEGRIALDGEPLDLDHAAIDLMQHLTKLALYQGTISEPFLPDPSQPQRDEEWQKNAEMSGESALYQGTTSVVPKDA